MKRTSALFGLAILIVLVAAGCKKPAATSTNQTPTPADQTTNVTIDPSQEPTMNATTKKFPGVLPDAERLNQQATIKLANGNEISFEIFGDEAPKAASNFIALTKDGFYNQLTFHRVEPGFVVQGGDPSGNGTGGPGYKFEDEPVTRDYTQGIVAMANAGPNTNGSQFFIMLADTPLPKQYTIFGKVTKGFEHVQTIKVGDVMQSVTIEAKQ